MMKLYVFTAHLKFQPINSSHLFELRQKTALFMLPLGEQAFLTEAQSAHNNVWGLNRRKVDLSSLAVRRSNGKAKGQSAR